MARSISEISDEIVEEFSLFDDWMDKYQYLIEIGQSLPPLDESSKIDENIVRGCQSKVWLDAHNEGDNVIFDADSDAIISKGLIGLLTRVYSGQPAAEILSSDLEFIDKIGIREHLSPNRSNGLSAMIKKMKLYALGLKHQKRKTKLNPVVVTKEQIIEQIKTVYDPEIPVNVYELGLIYEVKVLEDNNVHILMTLTAPACPAAEMIPEEIKDKAKGISEVNEVEVELTFDPPWDQEMMSEEAKLELGFL